MNQKRKITYFVYAILLLLLCSFGYIKIQTHFPKSHKAKESLKQNQSTPLIVEGNKETNESAPEEDIKPKLAITFDDGPHPVFTEKLLDGLKEREIQATFFVVGKNIPGNEAIIKRMCEEGHLIGNHTYDHVKITGMRKEDACLQISMTSDIIQEITGEPTEFIRAPFGTWNSSLEGDVAMFPVKWTIDPRDWTTANVDQIVQKVVQKVKDNDIILLHDYYASSIEAALHIIDILLEQGYEFVTVDEMILE